MAQPTPFSDENRDYEEHEDPSGRYVSAFSKVLQEGTFKYTKDFNTFESNFLMHIRRADFYNLQNILNGIEKPPRLGPDEDPADLIWRHRVFGKRVNLVLSGLQILIANYVFSGGEDAEHIQYQVRDITDPILYMDKLREVTAAKQTIDNIDTIQAWFKFEPSSSDPAKAYREYCVLTDKITRIAPPVTVADLISVRYLQTLPKSLEKVVEQACGEQVIPALPTLYGRVHASTLQQNLQAKVFSQRTGSALLAADAEGQALQASSGGGSRGGNRNYQKGGRGQGGRNQGQGGRSQGGRNQGQGGRSQGGRTQGQGGRSQGGRNQNQGGRNQGQGGRYQGQGNGRNQGQGNGQYQGQGRQSNRGYEAIIKLFNHGRVPT
jgi:hypothetical protein